MKRALDWIALYGSLMRGLGGMNSLGISDRMRYVGPCICAGELFDLGGYPGLRLGEARVVGELYAILDPQVLEILDEFEGFDPERPRESLYLRERTDLIDPPQMRAWVYRYNHVPDARARIGSGDWRAHLHSRSGT
ncbi:MAG: hypothetical protein GY910_10865 [bacterium]|nr:hypothetical protein [Deltaproteobacteria bacterium]MCP4905470.1 hypothetical protein [bacterium]